MKKVIFAPQKLHISEFQFPVMFLAGPIQNAPNWQEKAIDLLNIDNIIIANPRRNLICEEHFNDEMYKEQVDWEHYWLERAKVKLFWFPNPESINPNRAYAQTSRFELAEEMVYNQFNFSEMSVGIEPGFSGERYIRYTLSKKIPKVKICSSLEETCLEAKKLFEIKVF